MIPEITAERPLVFYVDATIRKHVLTCGVPEAEAWAAAWLSGADRSLEVVRKTRTLVGMAALTQPSLRVTEWAIGTADMLCVAQSSGGGDWEAVRAALSMLNLIGDDLEG